VRRGLNEEAGVNFAEIIKSMKKAAEKTPQRSSTPTQPKEPGRRASRKYRLIPETIQDVFWMSTPGITRMIYVSPAYETIWGRSRASLYDSPRSFLDAVHPDDRDKLIAGLQEHAAGKWDFEYRIVRPGGSVRWIRDRGFPVREKDGSVLYMTGIATDITDLMETLEASRRAEANYRSLADNAVVGIYKTNLHGDILYANKALATIFEFSDPDQMMRVGVWGLYKDCTDRQVFVDKIKQDGSVRNYELEVKTRTGKTKTILLSAVLAADELSGMIVDITDRKTVEEALLRSQERYALAQEAANIGSWDWNILTGELVWSEQIEPMFGFAKGHFHETYEAFLDCVHPDDRRFVTDSVQACIAHGRDYAIEHRIVWPDGTVRWVAENGDVFRSKTGKAVRMVGIVRDITDKKHVEQRQELGWKILERINQRGNEEDIIRDLLSLIKHFSGFDAVGIRLRQGDDFPYFEVNGFSEDFVEAENFLCAKSPSGRPVLGKCGQPLLECMCGNVLMGHTDAALPFFTEGGSFWTNSTTELVKSPELGKLNLPTRNRCNQAGFESVALIPLRSGEQTIGLLQLNDRRAGRFDLDLIRFLEGMGASVGIALARMNDLSQIRRLNEQLEERVIERTAELTAANRRLLRQIEQRRELEKEILAISEREQRRIGQELHDSVGQQLTGIAFLAKALQQRIAEKSLEEAAAAAEITELANQATDQTRALARGLHPVNLQAGSLVSALQELAVTTQHLFDISCTLESRWPAQPGDDEVSANIYRIVQEAVNNAVKHGKPRNVWIRLVNRNSKSVIIVENDGLDFPVDALEQTGLGLRIMGHRAEMINGSLDIRKRAEGGAIVSCTFTARATGQKNEEEAYDRQKKGRKSRKKSKNSDC